VADTSRKVVERLGHQPITPGGLRLGSDKRQYSLRLNTSCLHHTHFYMTYSHQ
jgi:hypothetical protein